MEKYFKKSQIESTMIIILIPTFTTVGRRIGVVPRGLMLGLEAGYLITPTHRTQRVCYCGTNRREQRFSLRLTINQSCFQIYRQLESQRPGQNIIIEAIRFVLTITTGIDLLITYKMYNTISHDNSVVDQMISRKSPVNDLGKCVQS